jgi:hypothetical protein
VPKFIKENFVLIVGLTLPVLLMAGFLVASNLPSTLSDPPKHDLIFAVTDSPGTVTNLPIVLRLVVKDRVLKAQYTRVTDGPGGASSAFWKKLYRYEAGPRTVRQLTFGVPADVDAITGTREETVEATAGLLLDTTLQSPDGYELSFGDSRPRGLFNELFWSSYSNELRLRKGASSVRLSIGDGRTYLYPGNVEFIGWVVGQK